MIKFYLKRYVWFLSASALIIALIFPQYGEIFHGKESLLLMGILFFNLLGVSAKDLLDTAKKPLSLILAVLALSGVFSAIIFIYKDKFSPDTFNGLILAASSGISFTGILIANIFGGDKARLFVLTILSFAISAFVISLIIPDINPYNLLLDTAIFLLIPVFFAGLFRLSPYGEAIEKHGSYFSLILFVIFIYSIVSSLSNVNFSMNIVLIAIAYNLLNMFFGFVIGKNRHEKISFSSATVLRNFEVALLFSVSALNPESTIVIMTFMIVSYVFVSPVLLFIAKK